MSRRTALASSIAAAVTAAAITAAAFLVSGTDDTTFSPTGTDAVASTISSTVTDTDTGTISNVGGVSVLHPDTDTTPIRPQQTDAEPLTTAVNWADIYERAVPSLVTVAAGGNSVGSGFFVTENGHIITNLHVIASGGAIRVSTLDDADLPARLIARDVGNDLALILIDPTDIDIVVPEFGSTDDLRVGDPVAALGSPYNLRNSLSVGIISGLGRDRNTNGTQEPLRDMIQVDSALNPGNSGGMLLDAQGRVIGIPTQIESPHAAFSGVGFAVNIDALQRGLPTMLNGQDVQRSYLGVQLSVRDGELYISDVTCGSSANLAGLRANDRLLEINGEPTATFDELVAVLVDTTPGDPLVIVVERGLSRLTLQTTARAWPELRPRSGCG